MWQVLFYASFLDKIIISLKNNLLNMSVYLKHNTISLKKKYNIMLHISEGYRMVILAHKTTFQGSCINLIKIQNILLTCHHR